MPDTTRFPELDCYLLPGHTQTPADAIDQARDAEAAGLGRVWLSERYDVKEAGVICSAALAVTERIKVATAATNLHTRHPLLLASLCTSLHYLSKGRFELGLSRGIAVRNHMMGIEGVNNAMLEDGVGLLRRLFQGEKIVGHDGPMGAMPYLSMGDWIDADIPIHFVGFGARSLRFAGKHFDGVHLHTFISLEGLRRAKALIQEGAEEAGRDPDAVKITTVCATALEPDRKAHLKKLIARMATYMQAPHYAEFLVELNGWDPEVLKAFREADVVKSIPGGIDSVATFEQLEEIEELIPEEWFPAAVGSAEDCARYWLSELDNGADSVCIHGSTAREVAPALEAYEKLRASHTN